MLTMTYNIEKHAKDAVGKPALVCLGDQIVHETIQPKTQANQRVENEAEQPGGNPNGHRAGERHEVRGRQRLQQTGIPHSDDGHNSVDYMYQSLQLEWKRACDALNRKVDSIQRRFIPIGELVPCWQLAQENYSVADRKKPHQAYSKHNQGAIFVLELWKALECEQLPRRE